MPLDKLFDRAFSWCITNLPVEPVVLGEKQREVLAIDSSTIARWRAKVGMDLLGKGFHHRAGKAIKANIIAAVTTVVFISGVRVGLVRRVRFGDSCEAAVAKVFQDLPKSKEHRLLVVDAALTIARICRSQMLLRLVKHELNFANGFPERQQKNIDYHQKLSGNMPVALELQPVFILERLFPLN